MTTYVVANRENRKIESAQPSNGGIHIIWKDIKGYEGIYRINEYGEVESLPRIKGAIYCKGRILKQELTKRGYKRVSLCKNDKVKRVSVHRLVHENFIGEIPEGLVVHHIDENKTNNHFSNLLACTQRENNHYSADSLGYKLKESDIRSIRDRNLSVKEIHDEYGISKRHALRIIKNERWAI